MCRILMNPKHDNGSSDGHQHRTAVLQGHCGGCTFRASIVPDSTVAVTIAQKLLIKDEVNHVASRNDNHRSLHVSATRIATRMQLSFRNRET